MGAPFGRRGAPVCSALVVDGCSLQCSAGCCLQCCVLWAYCGWAGVFEGCSIVAELVHLSVSANRNLRRAVGQSNESTVNTQPIGRAGLRAPPAILSCLCNGRAEDIEKLGLLRLIQESRHHCAGGDDDACPLCPLYPRRNKPSMCCNIQKVQIRWAAPTQTHWQCSDGAQVKRGWRGVPDAARHSTLRRYCTVPRRPADRQSPLCLIGALIQS